MAKKNIIGNIFSGQILLLRGGLAKNWKFVIYIFVLVIIYISVHFSVNETMKLEARNAETIKNLKSEYTGKYARLLYLSKRGEVERMLKEEGSTLVPPKYPPRIVTKDVR